MGLRQLPKPLVSQQPSSHFPQPFRLGTIWALHRFGLGCSTGFLRRHLRCRFYPHRPPRSGPHFQIRNEWWRVVCGVPLIFFLPIFTTPLRLCVIFLSCAWFDLQAVFYLLRSEFQRIHWRELHGVRYSSPFLRCLFPLSFFPSIHNPFAKLQCFHPICRTSPYLLYFCCLLRGVCPYIQASLWNPNSSRDCLRRRTRSSIIIHSCSP